MFPDKFLKYSCFKQKSSCVALKLGEFVSVLDNLEGNSIELVPLMG